MDTSLVDMDFNKLKVPELRKELKTRGLNTVGNKNELLERLQSAVKPLKAEDTTSAEADSVGGDLEEDLLKEDDDEHIDCDSVLNDLDSTLDNTVNAASPESAPPLQQGLKRKGEEGTAAQNGTPTKRIVLNRTLSTTTVEPVDSSTSTNGNTAEAISPVVDGDSKEKEEKKTVKLSELSAKERLEMRAKKFGVPLSGDAKKEARAERFATITTRGTTLKTKVTAKSTPITASLPASADVLKQRAERFGVKTSSTLTKLENQEKMEKRKQRFGNDSNGNGTSNTTLSGSTKAQQRLERFKQPVK